MATTTVTFDNVYAVASEGRFIARDSSGGYHLVLESTSWLGSVDYYTSDDGSAWSSAQIVSSGFVWTGSYYF